MVFWHTNLSGHETHKYKIYSICSDDTYANYLNTRGRYIIQDIEDSWQKFRFQKKPFDRSELHSLAHRIKWGSKILHEIQWMAFKIDRKKYVTKKVINRTNVKKVAKSKDVDHSFNTKNGNKIKSMQVLKEKMVKVKIVRRKWEVMQT